MSNIIDTIQVSGVNYTLSATSSGGGNSVVELTQAEYDDLVSGGTVDPTTIYIITDAEEINANDYVTKTSNVVSGYTTYTMLSNVNSGFYSDLTTNEILIRNVSTNKPSYLSFSFYIKGGNGNKTISLTLNFQAKTASTSSDVTTVWSDELDGFIITITSTSYPYFYGVSSLSYQDDCRIYYKTGTITDKQSAAYLNGIKKGVSGDYVVGFTNSTSVSSDGSITVQLLKENSSYVQKNFKVADTDDFSWGSKGISYKLVEGEYFYSTASLGSGNYCQLPSNAADNYQNGYLGVKLLINPNYNTQNNNRQITISLGGVTNKTDTYWGSYQNLYIYYNGYTDTVNFNNIVGTYGVSSATYDQTSHYITIVIDSESTYSSKYWAIRQIGQGNCWIGVNYQITEVQWYTNKYKPFEYLDKYKADVSAVTAVQESLSGKLDTSTFDNVMASYDSVLYGLSNRVTSAETSLSGKQDTLSAGTGIDITNNVISVTGGGGGGGKAVIAGRGIEVTTGSTADTVSLDLAISGGTGSNSIIQGVGTSASGALSHAEGIDNVASGTGAHAEGVETNANGDYSHSEGVGTVTYNMGEHAEGWYNESNTGNSTSAQTLFSVGNGESSARHNAFEIRRNGDIYFNDGTNDVKLQDKFSSLDSTIGDINTILQSI